MHKCTLFVLFCFAYLRILSAEQNFHIPCFCNYFLHTLYISIGLLCGTAFSDKMVGVLCGAVLTNISAWLSDIWFDLSLVGGAFEKIAGFLPFVHAVNAMRAVLEGDYSQIIPELLWVLGYAVVIFACAVWLFNRRMKQDK